MTKDERFLLEVYKRLKETSEEVCDPDLVARDLHYSERLTKNILRGLMQANFLKPISRNEVGLTDRGLALVQELLTTN